MTIRRDLDSLAAEGRIVRTYGGAAPASGVVFEFRFLERANERRAAKEAIGRRAGELVTDGMTVMLDSGTTTLALARQLRGKQGLTIVTTSLPIASELQHCDAIDVILLGGRLRRDAPDLFGALTLRMLEELHADVAFLGADAIDLKGTVYNRSVEVAHLITAMAGVSDVVYAVADSSKVGRTALGRIGSLAQWAGLITDGDLDDTTARKLRARGAKVIRAQNAKNGKRSRTRENRQAT